MDGYWGYNTTRALQQFLNKRMSDELETELLSVDGEFGSKTVTALQRYLNKQRVEFMKLDSPGPASLPGKGQTGNGLGGGGAAVPMAMAGSPPPRPGRHGWASMALTKYSPPTAGAPSSPPAPITTTPALLLRPSSILQVTPLLRNLFSREESSAQALIRRLSTGWEELALDGRWNRNSKMALQACLRFTLGDSLGGSDLKVDGKFHRLSCQALQRLLAHEGWYRPGIHNWSYTFASRVVMHAVLLHQWLCAFQVRLSFSSRSFSRVIISSFEMTAEEVDLFGMNIAQEALTANSALVFHDVIKRREKETREEEERRRRESSDPITAGHIGGGHSSTSLHATVAAHPAHVDLFDRTAVQYCKCIETFVRNHREARRVLLLVNLRRFCDKGLSFSSHGYAVPLHDSSNDCDMKGDVPSGLRSLPEVMHYPPESRSEGRLDMRCHWPTIGSLIFSSLERGTSSPCATGEVPRPDGSHQPSGRSGPQHFYDRRLNTSYVMEAVDCRMAMVVLLEGNRACGEAKLLVSFIVGGLGCDSVVKNLGSSFWG